MMLHGLDELELHDSVLLGLEVPRAVQENGGPLDEVRVTILHREYGDSPRPTAERVRTLVFADCRMVRVNLNFGFLNEDAIDGGKSVDSSPMLEEFRRAWPASLPKDLRHHTIWTSTTGGEIHILCESITLVEGQYAD